MPKRIPLDTEVIVSTYRRLGSKQKVAAELGVSWQSVAKHLNQFAGICPECWKPKEDTSKKFCTSCRKKHSDNSKTKRERKKRHGICIMCNEPIDPTSKAHCAKHKDMAREAGYRWRKNNPQRSKYLRDKRAHRNKDGSVNRHIIFERDSHSCLICGSQERLEIHHIDEDHYNNIPENMDTLCFMCHRAITFILKASNVSSLLIYFSKRYPDLLYEAAAKEAVNGNSKTWA